VRARDDRPGAAEPQRVYAFSSSNPGLKIDSLPKLQTPTKESNKPGFYVGGNIYTDWASVPELQDHQLASARPSRSTATLFNFKW
jgi:hypothetical protein